VAGCTGNCKLDGTCPVLSGYGRIEYFLNLKDKDYVKVSDLEITDSSACAGWNCGSSCGSVGTNCTTEQSGKIGIVTSSGSGNITFNDIYIHDLWKAGWEGAGSDLTCTDCAFDYNAYVGWDTDKNGGSTSGTISFTGSSPVDATGPAGKANGSKCSIAFSGCTRDATNTTILTNGCRGQGTVWNYGDGIGSGSDSGGQLEGDWTVNQCDISHNSSDGGDWLYMNYAAATGGTLTIKRSRFEGNDGNQLKGPNSITLEDNAIIGNCGYLNSTGKWAPGGAVCRASGNTWVIAWKDNSTIEPVSINNTYVGNGTAIILIEGPNTENCPSTVDINSTNDLFLGGRRFFSTTTSTDLYYNSALEQPRACAPELLLTKAACTGDFNHNNCTETDTASAYLQTAVSGTVYTATPTNVFTGTINQGPSTFYTGTDYIDQLKIKVGSIARNIGSLAVGDDKDINGFDRDAADGLADAGALEYGTTGASPGPVCGNNSTETTGGEVCDGTDLNGFNCSTVPGSIWNGGTLACKTDCTDYNTVACTIANPPCGNGSIDTGEQCDTSGPNLNGATCSSLGFSADPVDSLLACTASTCQFNTASCAPIACQDGYKEGSEGCDDGNATQGDGCSSLCQEETTGNLLFLNFTETDPNSRLAVATHALTATDITRNESAGIKYDVGAGNIGNFTSNYEYSQSSCQDGGTASIAYDAGSEATQDTLSTITFSHTVAAGSNRLLVVSITNEDGGTRTISSVAYGAQALTKAVGLNGTSNDVDIYYLLAPTVGTANVVVTWSGEVFGLAATADSFTGIAQQAPTTTGTATASNINLVTTTNNSLVISAVVAATSTATLSTQDIERHNFINTGSHAQGVSTKTAVEAGAVSVGWGVSTGNYISAAAVFAPANTGGGDHAYWGIWSASSSSHADLVAQDTANDGFFLYVECNSSAATTTFHLVEVDGGTTTEDTFTVNNVNPSYYGTIVRSGGTAVSNTFYSDPNRTVTVDAQSITAAATSHRYLGVGQTYNDSTSGPSVSAVISNMTLTSTGAPAGGGADQSFEINGFTVDSASMPGG
jgi:cysteine-rich repeat protein